MKQFISLLFLSFAAFRFGGVAGDEGGGGGGSVGGGCEEKEDEEDDNIRIPKFHLPILTNHIHPTWQVHIHQNIHLTNNTSLFDPKHTNTI
ncbi:hypothetical protein QVD17_25139 [Tagetes erecta]|uniref:Uncharacterized protein n=1 Tax=Tagetes erecta TaxID=13708 RepID=A0AAD8KFS0_TARER|nr:hypothetical protein QVD17_25139 [Tagetes erecta]